MGKSNQSKSENGYFTVPNLLCYARIFLTPVTAYYISEQRFDLALILFFIAGLSDALDGALARWFNQASRFGQFLDPIADKFFINVIFFVFAWLGFLPWWFAALVLTRDLLFGLAYGFSKIRKKPSDITPLAISKANTFLQVVLGLAIIIQRLYPIDLRTLIITIIAIVSVTSVLSAVSYFSRWLRLIRQNGSL